MVDCSRMTLCPAACQDHSRFGAFTTQLLPFLSVKLACTHLGPQSLIDWTSIWSKACRFTTVNGETLTWVVAVAVALGTHGTHLPHYHLHLLSIIIITLSVVGFKINMTNCLQSAVYCLLSVFAPRNYLSAILLLPTAKSRQSFAPQNFDLLSSAVFWF